MDAGSRQGILEEAVPDLERMIARSVEMQDDPGYVPGDPALRWAVQALTAYPGSAMLPVELLLEPDIGPDEGIVY